MDIERISQPLPTEVKPPHPYLRREGCLSHSQRRLAVLAAVEVVHEPLVGRLAQGAIHVDRRNTAGWLTFVDRREICGADWLGKKRRHSEEKCSGDGEQ